MDANSSVASVNGGLSDEDLRNPSIEASLDIQNSVSLAHRTEATYYTAGGRSTMIADTDRTRPEDSGNEPDPEQLRHHIGLPGDRFPAVLTGSCRTGTNSSAFICQTKLHFIRPA